MSFETLFYAILGWCVGGLINYAADTLPGRSGLGKAPACPREACGMPRAPAAWSAVVGYLSGRRVCPGCGAPRPMRCVLVEVAAPLMFVGLLWRYGLSPQLGLLSLYGAVLILVTVIDMEHRLIQHVVMAPAILVAAAGGFFNQDMTAQQALWGGVAGLVTLYGMYLLAGPVSRLLGRLAHREITEAPFGFGDVTLGTFVGLITGLPGVFLALLITILSAGVVAALLIVGRVVILRRYSVGAAIPYGPFLAFGGFIMMVYGPEILRWYVGRG